MTHFGKQEPARDFPPSLNRSKWEKGNKNRRKRQQCLGENFDTGKEYLLKRDNSCLFSPSSV